MADIRIVDLPETTNVYSTDEVIVEQADGTKKAEVSNLVKNMLTAGAGIQLDGTTISNVFSNLVGVDLDDITYQCIAYVNDLCTNKPTTYGGVLISKCNEASQTYGVQIFITYANTGKGAYYRNRMNGVWQGWNPLYLTAGNGIEISATGEIKNAFSNILSGDINSIKYNYQGYVGNSVTNKPTTNGGGLCCVMQSTGSYGYQLFNSNGSSNLYFRNLTNGTWQAWALLNPGNELLWTNSNSGSQFAGQTLTLDSSNYSSLLIVFRVLSTSSYHQSVVVKNSGYDQVVSGVLAGYTTICARAFTPRTNEIVFYNGYAGSTQDNTRMIPRFIYGIR